jgi:hypothetical protein
MSNADTLSHQGSGMTTQLFACAFKRAAKAGEALFFAFGG